MCITKYTIWQIPHGKPEREKSQVNKKFGYNRSGTDREYSVGRSKMLIAISVVILFLVTAFGLLYYNAKVEEFKLESVKTQEYAHYYVMITENRNTQFWKNVYESAKTAAAEDDAYVEMMGDNLSTDYSVADLMRIAIASKVNGIILEPDGDAETVDLINEASAAGIPVITVSEDEIQSSRTSFVGVNSYSLGQKYASEVVKDMDKDTRSILVLTNVQDGAAEENTVFTAIKERVAQSSVSGHNVVVTATNINSNKDFDAEEKIRNIILNSDTMPDILVCLDATDTECAFLSVREYNLVGDVTIIGYYSTDTILEGIKKNVIESTFAVDAEGMGEKCIYALKEFREMGRVSDSFNVDMTLINSDNISQYYSPEATPAE